MRRTTLLLVIACVVSIGIIAWQKHQTDERPLRTTGQGIPNAATHGNPEEAERRTRVLLTYLRSNKWQMPKTLPREIKEMLLLPDRLLSEGRINRVSPWTFSIPIPGEPSFGEIALYTSLYARQNRSYYKGERSDAKPSGFFIVGYCNGEVKRVPVSQMRILSLSQGGFDCFPDTSCYAKSEPNSFYSKSINK